MSESPLAILSDSFFHCLICHQNLTRPHSLHPCLHTFCETCVNDVPLSMKGGIIGRYCPMCEEFCFEGSLNHNVYVEQMMDIHSLADPESRACEQCKSHDNVTSACADCRIKLCSRCTETHTNIPLLKHHTIVALQQFHKEACEKWRLITSTLTQMKDKVTEVTELITETRKSYTSCRKKLNEHFDKVIQKIKSIKAEQEESLKRNEAEAVLNLQNTGDRLGSKLKDSKTLSGLLRLQQELGDLQNQNSLITNPNPAENDSDNNLNYTPSSPSSPTSSHSYVWSLLEHSPASPAETIQFSPSSERNLMLNFSPPSPSSASSDDMNNNSQPGSSVAKVCEANKSRSTSSVSSSDIFKDSLLEGSPYSPSGNEVFFSQDHNTQAPTFAVDYLYPEIHTITNPADVTSQMSQIFDNLRYKPKSWSFQIGGKILSDDSPEGSPEPNAKLNQKRSHKHISCDTSIQDKRSKTTAALNSNMHKYSNHKVD